MSAERELCNTMPPPDYKFGCPDNWVYRDMPKSHPDNYLKVIEIIGEDNYKLLSYAEYPTEKCDKGYVVRSQLMISPAGIENMKQYIKASTLTA